MGKKLLCLIMALCCVLGLVACGEKEIPADKASTDSTLHGGFIAETKDYVYFINGVESYTTDYKTGKVTKGALLRVKKSEFTSVVDGKEATNPNYETVVSKLIVSDDMNAGVYIYGDYVYYAVPSTENDRTGNVKRDQLNFFRTKLDATETSKKNIAGRDFAHGATFRYIQSAGTVYLVVYSTELYVYNADTGEQVYTTEAGEDADPTAKIDVAEVMFGKDSVYFTSLPVNKLLSNKDNVQKHAYHVVYEIDFAGKKAVEVINGAGTTKVNGETNPNGFGLLGVTIDLLRVADGALYFSYSSLNTVSSSTPVYVKVAESKLTAKYATTWHTELESTTLTVTTPKTANIFADTSIYHGGKIYYVDSSVGLVSYDPTASYEDTNFGVSTVYYSETIKGATLDYVNNESGVDYLYFHSSGNYYKVKLDGSDEEFRINVHAVDTDWYKPEVVKVGEKYYFVAAYSSEDFKSYVYAIDMAAVKAAYDAWDASEDEDKPEDFYAVEEDEDAEDLAFDVFAKRNNVLGSVTEADIKGIESTSESVKA